MASFLKDDPDRAKGAIEIEKHNHDGNLGLSEQLGHRDQDPLIKGADTDFPEPGESPEHSSGKSGAGGQGPRVKKSA